MPAYLGQHFLIDEEIARKAVEALEIRKDDLVVEIGPGKGVLTRHLVRTGASVVAIELDQDLIGDLKRDVPEGEHFRIVHSDFLKVDLDDVLERPHGVRFIGNLPYAVASPILQKVLSYPPATLGVFMFQKEVCERLVAGPGSRDYGILSIVAALHAEVSWVCEAPRDRFRPRPQVESGVLKFRMRKRPLPGRVDPNDLLHVAKAAFSQRRKQIVNPLSQGLGLEKAKVVKALEQAGIPVEARAETVSIDSFARLTSALR